MQMRIERRPFFRSIHVNLSIQAECVSDVCIIYSFPGKRGKIFGECVNSQWSPILEKGMLLGTDREIDCVRMKDFADG